MSNNPCMFEQPEVLATPLEHLLVRHCETTNTDISLCLQAFLPATSLPKWHIVKKGESKSLPSQVLFQRPLILICGLNCSMMFYPDELCKRFVRDGGFDCVIRFDNRCVGQSTQTRGGGQPSICCIGCGFYLCCCSCSCCGCCDPVYSLEDMADDVVALCDKLGFARFSVCGMSKGGMIAGCLAISPSGSRLDKLILIYSAARMPTPTRRCMMALATLPSSPSSREGYIDAQLSLCHHEFFIPKKVWASLEQTKKGGATAYLRQYVGRIFDHDQGSPHGNPADGGGRERHIGAILTQSDRTELLKERVKCPTLILCGEKDELCPPVESRRLHEAIADSDFLLVPEMGHSLVMMEEAEDEFLRRVKALGCSKQQGSGQEEGEQKKAANINEREPLLVVQQ